MQRPCTPRPPTLTPPGLEAEEDYNGDLLLLRYLLGLLSQDLAARLAVFRGWADVAAEVAGKRAALLSNSLLWRIWLDQVGALPSRATARHAASHVLPCRCRLCFSVAGPRAAARDEEIAAGLGAPADAADCRR